MATWTRYEGGMTPLLFAIDRGHQDVVRVLLDGGAKVDGANPNGLTPLQFAMIRRNEALALFLLERGADPNNAGPGFPPLHVAAYLGQPAVAKALIARGADVNARIDETVPADRGRWRSASTSIRVRGCSPRSARRRS